MIGVQVALVLIQVAIALVGYFTIHRHRSIYGIKTAVLRMPHGTAGDEDALKMQQIDKELLGGKYTVLQIVERADKDLEIIMGQIRK